MLVVENLHRPGLAPVSFSLEAGRCLAVMGPSGSGKSLLLRAIADLDPNEGNVTLAGKKREIFSGPAWRRSVAYLPAEPGWWDDKVKPHFEDWDRAAPLADRLSLDPDVADRPIVQLSTGERQRLALIRSLLRDPTVLLLDEPTAALDAASAAAAETLIKEQLAKGAAVVWVTHDRDQAARMADSVLQLIAGAAVKAAA